jgi:hypothetical protein
MKSSRHPNGIVPYITSWTGELALPEQVIGHGLSGIGFADERPRDRDDHDVLWTRRQSRPGTGRPEFRRVHPTRQRRAMRRLLCQVCARPADRNFDGMLFLLTDDRDDWPDWPEGMANTFPPVCLRCARLSINACPALRKGYVAVRARHFPYAGVHGTRYVPGQPDPIPIDGAVVTYDEFAIRWTCASQLVRTLHDCTIVDLSPARSSRD